MAVNRRQPTASPKTAQAIRVMVSGRACMIAVTLAIGILKRAVRKKNAVAVSARLRRSNSIASRGATRIGIAPMRQAMTETTLVVITPRRNKS